MVRSVPPDETGVTGVVLAGGQSRRMGRDKALLQVNGETLLARTVRLVATATHGVLVVGRTAGEMPTPDVRAVRDDEPGRGPLGGIATALRTIRTERAFVVGCDMPLLQPVLIRFLVALDHDWDAVVPRTLYGPEPLHAVYARSCLPIVETCLREGERSVTALLAHVRTRYVEPAEWSPYDPEGLSFLNANTPDEWRRIVARTFSPPHA